MMKQEGVCLHGGQDDLSVRQPWAARLSFFFPRILACPVCLYFMEVTSPSICLLICGNRGWEVTVQYAPIYCAKLLWSWTWWAQITVMSRLLELYWSKLNAPKTQTSLLNLLMGGFSPMCQVVMIPYSFFANDDVDRESHRNWLELTVPPLIGREHPRGTGFFPFSEACV